jgi:hypothetical protein
MRHEMMARKAKKQVTATEQLEELTSAELTEVSGGYGYGGGTPFYRHFPYGGFRYGCGVPFYGRPRYRQVYFPYN